MALSAILEQAGKFYEEIADAVIEEIKALDYDSHSQAPADLGLLTIWDDYKEQIQNGESDFFEVYQATFRQFINQTLKDGYIEWEILVMWMGCNASHSHDIENGLWWDDLCEGIAGAVLSEMETRAGNEEIEYRAGYGPEGEIEEEDEEDEESDEENGQLELF